MNATTILGADALVVNEETDSFLTRVFDRTGDLLAKVNWVALGSGVFWGAMTYIGGYLTVTFLTAGAGALGIALAIVYGGMTLWFGCLSVLSFCNVLNTTKPWYNIFDF